MLEGPCKTQQTIELDSILYRNHFPTLIFQLYKQISNHKPRDYKHFYEHSELCPTVTLEHSVLLIKTLPRLCIWHASQMSCSVLQNVQKKKKARNSRLIFKKTSIVICCLMTRHILWTASLGNLTFV